MKTMTATVRAGTYFLGDPVYAVPDEDWPALVRDPDGFPFTTAQASVRSCQVTGFPAAGDGVYDDQYGAEYLVDSGTLGLVPQELYGQRADADGLARLGRIVTFGHEVTATARYADGTSPMGVTVTL